MSEMIQESIETAKTALNAGDTVAAKAELKLIRLRGHFPV